MFPFSLNQMTIFIMCCIFVNAIANVQNLQQPQETQKAECTVTAGEVKATAEASTTRILKGVCGSAEMNLAFENLERKLSKELQDIKNILYHLHTGSNNNRIVKNSELIELKTEKSSHKIEVNLLDENFIASTTESQKLANKSIDVNRHQEIKKLNNTVLTGGDIKIFSYYWRVDNFSSKVNENSSTEESPIFTIFGKPLRVRASYNHLHRDFLFLKLEFANFNTQDTFKNIILDTGNLFHQIEQNTFKHKISILDQVNPSNDLISQEFTTLENGFLIPNSALLSNPYSKNNSLLIKIFLYL